MTLTQTIRQYARAVREGRTVLPTALAALRNALAASQPPERALAARLRGSLGAAFVRALRPRALRAGISGVTRFHLDSIQPELRAELERRIIEAAEYIKLDRERRIAETLQRFSGWATSVPRAGAPTSEAEVREELKKIAAPARGTLAMLHRVEIDQGHKLVSAIHETVAKQSGAIAAIWHDHGKRDKSYHARPEHLRRDGKIFIIKDGWANQKGMVKHPNGFIDDIERPGEEVFCRCWYEYLSSLSELPKSMLTAKGEKFLSDLKSEANASRD